VEAVRARLELLFSIAYFALTGLTTDPIASGCCVWPG
jgi:hypothetical protein